MRTCDHHSHLGLRSVRPTTLCHAATAIFVALATVGFHLHLNTTRINLNPADLAVATILPLAITLAWRARSALVTIPHEARLFWLSLALVTVALAVAFIVGVRVVGFQKWAIFNRLIGWGVLMSYVFVIWSLLMHSPTWLNLLRIYLMTIVAITLAWFIYNAGEIATNIWYLTDLEYERLQPVPSPTQDRNAFALILLQAVAVAMGLLLVERGVRWRCILFAAVLVLLVAVVGTGSRAALASMIVVAIVYALARVRWTRCRVVVVTSSALLLAGTFLFLAADRIDANAIIDVYRSAAFAGSADIESKLAGFSGSDQKRLTGLLSALRQYSESPWTGIGLGTFLTRQVLAGGPDLVIHNSFAWMLVELGPLGLLSFGGLFGLSGVVFVRNRRDPAGLIGLLTLTNFAVFALVHDVLYQRHFWILFCLCFAVVVLPRRMEQTSSA